jgi:hypothetical protein
VPPTGPDGPDGPDAPKAPTLIVLVHEALSVPMFEVSWTLIASLALTDKGAMEHVVLTPELAGIVHESPVVDPFLKSVNVSVFPLPVAVSVLPVNVRVAGVLNTT